MIERVPLFGSQGSIRVGSVSLAVEIETLYGPLEGMVICAAAEPQSDARPINLLN